MILVSACLLGHRTRYDGGSNDIALLMEQANHTQFITFCPEIMGGLPTPRPAAEITSGSGDDVLTGQSTVLDKNGNDVTSFFICGAEKSTQLANKHNITAAILKQRSPSCGSNQIYDGTFKHRTKSGMGVTAAMLHKLGIPLYSEEDITPEQLQKLLK
ncbi:DUF523 domain-containing protein [Sporomusa ovata]|uniref:DUF523 domain-containing protein n=1 Tax=Sporomusa ovata TaxID=2378 RepID=UPI00048FBCB5|nr:DUF523 domain-containing protein [Sporomusa ovata]